MSIATEISRLTTAKADMKTALEAKGVTVGTALLDTYDTLISSISAGTDISDATAAVGDVLATKTFYAGATPIKTGTMTNRGAVSTDITTKAQSVTIDAGYHNGSGTVQISSAEQAKIIAANIKKDIEILGVTGTVDAGGGWSPPSDWIDISTVADNEINLLVGDFGVPTIAFATTVASSGTYSIDWGDGTVETSRASGTTYQHSYTVGAGTSCSLGYTTFKIRIYGATGNITRWQIKAHNVTTNTQYNTILSAKFGTTALTSLDSVFYDTNSSVYQYSQELVSCEFPSSLNSCTTMGYGFRQCIKLYNLVLPTSMSSLTTTGLNYTFYNCYVLPSITLPTTIGAITTLTSTCQYCYNLGSFTFPSGITTITNLTDCFATCSSLIKVVYPTTLDSLTTMTRTHYQNYNLISVTLPTSMNALTSLQNCFNSCYVLPPLTLPTSLGAVTDCISIFQNCYSLNTITNLSGLGKTTSTGCNFTTAFDSAEMLTSITLGAFISKFSAKGASGKLNKLNSLSLTNTASTWGGTSPQIDVSYTSLGLDAMNALLESLPSNTFKTIAITGATAAAYSEYNLTCDTTAGSATVACTSTTNIVAGMGTTTNPASLTPSAVASTDIFTLTAHGFSNGQVLYCITTSSGLVSYTKYYVKSATTDTFQLSLTDGGSTVDVTTDITNNVSFIIYRTVLSVVANTSVTFDYPFTTNTTGTVLSSLSLLKRNIAARKGWTVTG